MRAATDEKNIARIVGFVILATFVGLLLCWVNDKRLARKRKEAERKRRLTGMSNRAYDRRRKEELKQIENSGFMA